MAVAISKTRAEQGNTPHGEEISPREFEIALLRARVASRSWSAIPDKERWRVLDVFRSSIPDHLTRIVQRLSPGRAPALISALHAETRLMAQWPEFASVRPVGHTGLAGVVIVVATTQEPLVSSLLAVLQQLGQGRAVITLLLQPALFILRLLHNLAEAAGLPLHLWQVLSSPHGLLPVNWPHPPEALVLCGWPVTSWRMPCSATGRLLPAMVFPSLGHQHIVCRDANLPQAIEAIYHAIRSGCGTRVYADQAVEIDLITILLQELNRYPESEAASREWMLVSGRLITLRDMLTDAARQGARIHWVGKADARAGYFLPPAVVSRVTPAMQLGQGPVPAPLIPVLTTGSLREAVLLVTRSGHTGPISIWTRGTTITPGILDLPAGPRVEINRLPPGITTRISLPQSRPSLIQTWKEVCIRFFSRFPNF